MIGKLSSTVWRQAAVQSRNYARSRPGKPLLQKTASESASEDSEFDKTQHYTVVAPNGVVACWHPAKKHPYEHTRPLPEELSTASSAVHADFEEKAVLDDELRMRYRHRHSRSGPSRLDLQHIFYMTKHEWYPKPLERRIRSVAQPPPKYRDGI